VDFKIFLFCHIKWVHIFLLFIFSDNGKYISEVSLNIPSFADHERLRREEEAKEAFDSATCLKKLLAKPGFSSITKIDTEDRA